MAVLHLSTTRRGRNGKLELPLQDFIILLDARRVKRKVEEVCVATFGDATYVYLPERKYLAKFTGSELEYDIPDLDNYYTGLYSVEDVNNIEEIKEACRQSQKEGSSMSN